MLERQKRLLSIQPDCKLSPESSCLNLLSTPSLPMLRSNPSLPDLNFGDAQVDSRNNEFFVRCRNRPPVDKSARNPLMKKSKSPKLNLDEQLFKSVIQGVQARENECSLPRIVHAQIRVQKPIYADSDVSPISL